MMAYKEIPEELTEGIEKETAGRVIPPAPPPPMEPRRGTLGRLKSNLGKIGAKVHEMRRGELTEEEYRKYRHDIQMAKRQGEIKRVEGEAGMIRKRGPVQWRPGPIVAPRIPVEHPRRSPFDVRLPPGMRAGAPFDGRLLPQKQRSYMGMMGTGYGGRLVPRRRR